MPIDAAKIAVHPDPIWRERGNSIIVVDLEDGHTEELCARRLSENEFEICCIPFFAYDIAPGDVVEASPSKDGRFLFRRVVDEAGRLVFRIWFGDVATRTVRYDALTEVTRAMAQFRCEQEWSPPDLLVVAVEPDRAGAVAEYLSDLQKQKRLIYDEART
jgi:Domain of unknown function (DUF4265)